jgi:hypothetical protein
MTVYWCAAAREPKPDLGAGWTLTCPIIKSTALRKRIITLSDSIQKSVYHDLTIVPFSALTMGSGQIHINKPVITIIISRIRRLGFTNSIEVVDDVSHKTFSKSMVKILNDL